MMTELTRDVLTVIDQQTNQEAWSAWNANAFLSALSGMYGAEYVRKRRLDQW